MYDTATAGIHVEILTTKLTEREREKKWKAEERKPHFFRVKQLKNYKNDCVLNNIDHGTNCNKDNYWSTLTKIK